MSAGSSSGSSSGSESETESEVIKQLKRKSPIKLDKKKRLPETNVFGEAPHTALSDDEVDMVARHVLRGARKARCDKTDEYCQIHFRKCKTEKCREAVESQSKLNPKEKAEIQKLLKND